ncbi:MAG: choice-of-anchor D domain-containing protein [Deltaproteobacteria bacterium]|nr:choice-of-anchor D domain-containing protein [Deltaproteobacteria bacterium]
MKVPHAILLATTLFGTTGCENVLPAFVLEPIPPGLRSDPHWLTFTCVAKDCDTSLTINLGVEGPNAIAVKRIVLSDAARTDFEVTSDRALPFILEPRKTAPLTVRYRPDGDPRNGEVTVDIAYTDARTEETGDRVEPGTLKIPLLPRLIGAAALAVEPSKLHFGAVKVGETPSRTLKLTNQGSGNVGLVFDTIETDLDALEVEALPAYGLAPGTAWDAKVTYTPTEEAILRGLIIIKPSTDGVPATAIPVIGTSIAAPRIEVSPTTIELGALGIGATSEANVQITNVGGQPLSIRRVVAEASETDSPGLVEAHLARSATVASLSPLESIEAQVHFESEASGEVRAVLRIDTNDPQQATTEIPISGIVVRPKIAVDQESIDFGLVPKGWSLRRTVAIENAGHGTLSVAAATWVTGSSTLFTIHERPRFPAALEHGQRIAFAVEFRAETEASFSATLSIESDDPDRAIVPVQISARGAPCSEGCPITHGAPSCVSGACEVEHCDDGWHDADGEAANGCECQEPNDDPGGFCASSRYLGSLSDTDGDRASWTGILPALDDVDVLRFFAEDNTNLFSDDYDVQVALETTDPGIKMCVYRHRTGQHENECTLEGEQCGVFYRQDGSNGDDAADYAVRVFRDDTSPTTCTPYTVFVRNG